MQLDGSVPPDTPEKCAKVVGFECFLTGDCKDSMLCLRVNYLEVNSYLKINLFWVKGKNSHVLISDSKMTTIIRIYSDRGNRRKFSVRNNAEINYQKNAAMNRGYQPPSCSEGLPCSLILSRCSNSFYICLGFSGGLLRLGCHLFLVCISGSGSVLNTLSCFQIWLLALLWKG